MKACKKLNIRYFALLATALGLMRNNGFIQTDNDIDFYLPREDYDKFVKISQNYFQHVYLFKFTK